MINAILALFLIQVIVVFIVDISGAADSLKTAIKWVLTKGKFTNPDYRLKPFDCSLCMTFWSTMTYLLCTNQFTLPLIAVGCLLAAFAGLTKNAIILVEDSITRVIQLIYEKIIDRHED